MSKGKNIGYGVHIGLFVGVLATAGTLFFVLPEITVSEVEKRKLSPFPHYSLDSLFYGSYMDSVDLYIADHFPYREDWMELNFYLRDLRGKQNEEEAFYEAPALNVEIDKEEDQELIEDTTTVLDPDEEFREEKVERNNGILISDGQALQIFGGNDQMAAAYAKTVNMYRDELGDSVKIFTVVIPTPAEFYLPSKYDHLKGKERKNLNKICESLNPGITCVDAYSKMEANQDKYLYFRTDHHWTGLGAYYAYTAFCESAGITPPSLSQMERNVKKNFFGSLYQLTKNQQLAENPDSVEYWKVPNSYTVERFEKWDQFTPLKGSLYAEYASGGNSYGVFLGGDKALMVVETGNRNGKVAMILKNSYGNPFSTYFAYNFERVVIVDYRYFSRGVIPVMQYYGVNHLVFINGAMSANTPYHINRIRRIMNAPAGVRVLEPPLRDTIPDNTDTLEVDTPDTTANPDNIVPVDSLNSPPDTTSGNNE